jgi:hypothetical protein
MAAVLPFAFAGPISQQEKQRLIERGELIVSSKNLPPIHKLEGKHVKVIVRAMDSTQSIIMKFVWRNGLDKHPCFKDAECWDFIKKCAVRQGMASDRKLDYCVSVPWETWKSNYQIEKHNILRRLIQEDVKEIVWFDKISPLKAVLGSNLLI